MASFLAPSVVFFIGSCYCFGGLLLLYDGIPFWELFWVLARVDKQARNLLNKEIMQWRFHRSTSYSYSSPVPASGLASRYMISLCQNRVFASLLLSTLAQLPAFKSNCFAQMSNEVTSLWFGKKTGPKCEVWRKSWNPLNWTACFGFYYQTPPVPIVFCLCCHSEQKIFLLISICRPFLSNFNEMPSVCGLGFLGNLDCGMN